MLNVKIYCPTTHPDYDTTFQIVKDVLSNEKLNFTIDRINKLEELYRLRILYPPQIVINCRVVFSRRCPTKEDMLQILKKMHLIKKHNEVSISQKSEGAK